MKQLFSRRFLAIWILIAVNTAMTILLLVYVCLFRSYLYLYPTATDKNFIKYLLTERPEAAISALHQVLNSFSADPAEERQQRAVIVRLYLLHRLVGDEVNAQKCYAMLSKRGVSKREVDAAARFFARGDYYSGVIWGACAVAKVTHDADVSPMFEILPEERAK